MKKLLFILISLSIIFNLCACDILELSAPEAETTEETSTDSEATTVEGTTTEDETYYGGSHKSCEYCGQLEGNNRWFIAKVTEDLMVIPMGTDCFEAKAAMDAGITLHYSEVNGDPNAKLRAGDTIDVEYNGMIMESYPVQIIADKVSVIYRTEFTPEEKLSKYELFYGDVAVTSGETEIFPICGFLSSEEYRYDEATGETNGFFCDGVGTQIYLGSILDGSISDELIPVLTLDGNIEISYAKDIKYIALNESVKKEVCCELEELSSLPEGQYYVTFSALDYLDEVKFCYEYLFKLVVN